MAKAQGSSVFVFALIAVFAVLILYFAFSYMSNLAESTREKEMIIFVKSVQSIIAVQSKQGSGSSVDKILAVPSEVESICFVDKSKAFDNLANSELTTQIGAYPEANFFIMPLEKFKAEKLDGFELDKTPLCVNVINGKLRLKLTSQQGTTNIDALSKEDQKEECTSVFYTSEPSQGVDIVFLGQAYKDSEDFKSEVYKYINDVFFSLEPFRSNRDKFNFYMIDNFKDLGCTFNGYAICDNFKVKKLASKCPHEFIFILIDRNKIKDFINPIRSSAVSNIANINTADKPLVVMHEFGHSFADLADEYIDPYYLTTKFEGLKYPNCDNKECSKWSSIEGTGCFKGCSTSGFYRGTDDSLMKSLSSNYFGPINEEAIMKVINVYKR